MSSDSRTRVPFREEAVAYHFREADSRDILPASPLWTWLILCASAALLIAALVFVTLIRLQVPIQAAGTIDTAKGTQRVVALINDFHDLRVQRGDRVRLSVHGYPPAQFGYLEGRITEITRAPTAAKSTPKPTKQALARVDIAIQPAATGPLAVVDLRNGMGVNIRFAAPRKRLISILLGRGWR